MSVLFTTLLPMHWHFDQRRILLGMRAAKMLRKNMRNASGMYLGSMFPNLTTFHVIGCDDCWKSEIEPYYAELSEVFERAEKMLAGGSVVLHDDENNRLVQMTRIS